MELIGILVFLFLIIGVVVLVVVLQNQKKDATPTLTGTPPVTPAVYRNTYTEPTPTPEPEVKQITMFMAAQKRRRICAYCDAENEPSARLCRICGMTLEEKGVVRDVL